VTWYGADGERIELSAKVLDNWVAKSANFLVDELDAGPGSAVLVDLPGHWRTLAWLLAIWATGGAAVVVSGTGQRAVPPLPAGLHPDAVLTARPRQWAGLPGATLLAVALPALATRFTGDLPATAVDAATEVRGHGDVFVPLVRPVPADPALVTPDGTVTAYGDLLATPATPATAATATTAATTGRLSWRPGVRLLTGSGPDQVLTGWLPALLAGGSLVLHHDLPGLDAVDRDRLVAQEGIHAVDDRRR
jgi:uncharacterized protein (TIGR03089 family)